MSARQNQINLLPKSEFELSYWGRFLKWALSTGRYIIILTEIVVIGAFLSRFKFDQELADLTDAVRTKQEILRRTANTELHFRTVQKRMNAAASLIASQNKPSLVFDDIATILPEGMKLSSITVIPGQVVVVAAAGGELEVGAFLNQLVGQTNAQGGRKWKSVNLNELATSSDAGVKFSFTAQY